MAGLQLKLVINSLYTDNFFWFLSRLKSARQKITSFNKTESFEKMDRFPIIAFGRHFLDQGGA
jgi:hypothetical protein